MTDHNDEPFFAGRDGKDNKAKYMFEKAARARPIVTAIYAGIGGLIAGSVIAGTAGLIGGYNLAEWMNSDEYRIQQEKMWDSNRTEREAQRAEDAKVAADEAIKKAAKEAEQAKKDKLKAEEKAKADKVKAAEDAKKAAAKKAEQAAKTKREKPLIEDLLSRGSIQQAICYHQEAELTGTFDSNNKLTNIDQDYTSAISTSLAESTREKTARECLSNFPYESFLKARGLPKKIGSAHYEQIKDMMSLCGKVTQYKTEPNHHYDGRLTLTFTIKTGMSGMGLDSYKDYQKCLIGSLNHPLIKTSTQPETEKKHSSPKPQ